MPKKPARPKRQHRISDTGRERRGDNRVDEEQVEKLETGKAKPSLAPVPWLKRKDPE